jgi:osmotically inducible protein OsmC
MLELQSREPEAERLDRALDEALAETFPASDPPAVLIDDGGTRRVPAGLVPANSTGDTPMDKIKPLFTATATATGGRNGHTEASDGTVKADLSVPKEMGGPGKPGTATPEHLFAAGYAACFGGALDFVGKQRKKDASKAKITCAVSIGPRDGGGFGLAVKLHVEDKSLPQAELAALANEAHEKICPYSHATRGNVDVALEVVGG